MATGDQSQRDLVLGEGQYAYIQDQTKGHVGIYTGPHKTSLAGTDTPVRFDTKSGKFIRCGLDESIQEFVLAPEGSYIVLTNPANDDKHPISGASNRSQLSHGRKVIIPGPTAFALWPGQSAQVVEGHRLRSNQFLVARVYNEEAARENWKKVVLKPAAASIEGAPSGGATPPGGSVPPDQTKTTDAGIATPAAFVMGQKLIIKGTDVSFFIPPTGIEVEPTQDQRYVRDAVTLERLEYCLLLGENGAKRYVVGPNVVFPEPTESFVEKDQTRKFRATELNDDMGLHVKVIADYEDGGEKRLVGEELFITGKQQRIYYPREEHAVIKYGDRERVYGTVIPKGEARYVLDKLTGDISLVPGPRIFLPDPRTQVIVRRVLSEQQVSDYFPGNTVAVAVNASLRAQTDEVNYVVANAMMASAEEDIGYSGHELVGGTNMRGAVRKLAGDQFTRGRDYTPPRTITIDQRYDGAVQITPWIGYAVLVLGKNGQRRVVMGPDSTLLAFDESLQVLQLSTGKPKTTDQIVRTAYLLVANNNVSDIVRVVTSDMVEVEIRLSYRVNFEGSTDAERLRWFSTSNYVKFLCDHARSRLRSAAKKVGIEELNAGVTQIVRDSILGAPKDGEKRPGLFFEENGMRVCDVEVLNTQISDVALRNLLVNAQHTSVTQALQIGEAERSLKIEQRRQTIEREKIRDRDETDKVKAEIAQAAAERALALKLSDLAARATAFAEQSVQEVNENVHQDGISSAVRERQKLDMELTLSQQRAEQTLELEQLTAEAEAHVKRFGAVSPQFVAALQSFGDTQLTVKATEALGVMSLFGGGSVAEILHRVFKGTKLEGAVENLTRGLPSNGGATPKA
jgi:major vault protein